MRTPTDYGPEIVPPLGGSEYWETHKQLIHILDHIGIKYRYKQRLPLFKLHLAVDGWKQKDEFAKAALDLISKLAAMRQNGHEPQARNGLYL